MVCALTITYLSVFKGVSMIRVDFDPISETVYIDIILNTIIERQEIFFFMISLCPLLLSNINGGGSN